MSSTPNEQRNLERPSITVTSFVTLLVAILVAFAYESTTSANVFGFRRFAQTSWAAIGSRRPLSTASNVAPVQDIQKTPAVNGLKMKTPVYFLSHGGVRYCYPSVPRKRLLEVPGHCLSKLTLCSPTSCMILNTRHTRNWAG